MWPGNPRTNHSVFSALGFVCSSKALKSIYTYYDCTAKVGMFNTSRGNTKLVAGKKGAILKMKPPAQNGWNSAMKFPCRLFIRRQNLFK